MCSLFPKWTGILISLSCGIVSVGSLFPQLWLILIRAEYISRPQILYVWLGWTILATIISTFVFPWHSVTNENDYPAFFSVLRSADTKVKWKLTTASINRVLAFQTYREQRVLQRDFEGSYTIHAVADILGTPTDSGTYPV